MDKKSKNRALIVDDEAETCQIIRSVLHSHGMEALILTRSASAAAHLWAEKFSIVLLDLRMAHPDGIELTRRIRVSGINQKTPIVILSDDEDPAALSEGFEAGANDFETVYQAAVRATSVGGALNIIYAVLMDIEGMPKRRAEDISRSLNFKAKAIMNAEQQTKLGERAAVVRDVA